MSDYIKMFDGISVSAVDGFVSVSDGFTAILGYDSEGEYYDNVYSDLCTYFSSASDYDY